MRIGAQVPVCGAKMSILCRPLAERADRWGRASHFPAEGELSLLTPIYRVNNDTLSLADAVLQTSASPRLLPISAISNGPVRDIRIQDRKVHGFAVWGPEVLDRAASPVALRDLMESRCSTAGKASVCLYTT